MSSSGSPAVTRPRSRCGCWLQASEPSCRPSAPVVSPEPDEAERGEERHSRECHFRNSLVAARSTTYDERHLADTGSSRWARARGGLEAARARLERTCIGDLVAQLRALDFVNWTTIFGAELLWSALPFIILLSSLANHRIDSDLSRHIGLDRNGARIVTGLFRTTPAHDLLAIATGLIFTAAGLIAVVGSLQVIYERTHELEHRGWRDLPRQVVWVAVLLGALVAEGSLDGPLRRSLGPVLQALVTFVFVGVFFAWTMHFLLAGRVPWRRLVEPVLITSILWLALAFFSSAYFSSTIVSDKQTYGTIGVAFTLLTWFFMIGAVIILGAAGGAVWQRRSGRRPGPRVH